MEDDPTLEFDRTSRTEEFQPPSREGGDLMAALSRWDRFEVLSLIARGGMGEVFKAWDPRLTRHVAIKVLPAAKPEAIQRFVREAEAQAKVVHDNVLRVFETGIFEERHYIVMEYVEGTTLLEIPEPLCLEEKVEIMRQVCDGVQAAHRIGLIHRDIKPTNILVECGPSGYKAFVADFGLAKEIGTPGITTTGSVVGTPSYMAPERIRPTGILDRRSDVYSIGATFYEFLTGSAPFESDNVLEVLVQAVEEDPRPPTSIDPSIPAELDAVILKCLEKNPSHRYSSARALADELERFLEGEPVAARGMSTARRALRRWRQQPVSVSIAVVLGLLLVALVISYGLDRLNAKRSAGLIQHFIQEAGEIEWRVRVARMAPVHSLEKEFAVVRGRLESLERDVQNSPELALGPGFFALGRRIRQDFAIE